MAKKNYEEITNKLLKAVGGEGNIANITHCMTRLRLQLADKSKLNEEEAKNISGVLNIVIQNGEYQFVIGQDVPLLYEEMVKHIRFKAGGTIEDAVVGNKDILVKGKMIGAVFSFIGGTFSSVIPILVAGGLTGAVLTLLATFAVVSVGSGTYKVFSAISQTTFYFLPIFVGFSAANRLKSNGYLGAFLGAILLTDSINGVEKLDFLGIKIQTISYHSNIFSVILGVLFLSVVYKFFQRSLPVCLRTIFVPLLTMLITIPIMLIVLAPIGNTVSTLLSTGILAVYRAIPALSVAIVSITTCWMVFFGMNNVTYLPIFLLMEELGSDPLICTGMAPANVAVGGACLAVALIAKSEEERSASADAGVKALCGVTEPGIYGVLFVKKYPLIGAMLGGGIGGFFAGLLGMTQYVISTPGFISFAAYITPLEKGGGFHNLAVSMMVMAAATAISFTATYVLGKNTGEIKC